MAEEDPGYELIYWGITGRGMFVRLIFAEAGVPLKDARKPENVMKSCICKGGGVKGAFPAFAPPVLVHGNFRLSQVTYS